VSSILDALYRRPFRDFENFCAALITAEQVDVIVDLMTPEVQSQGGSSKNMTTTDAMPADVQPEGCLQPDFDWRAVMRRNLTALTKCLDPDNGLFEKLCSRGVISDWNIDIFKVCICFMCKLHH